MKMTNVLAIGLLQGLACVAVSANGGCPIDENDNVCISEEQLAQVNEYTKNKFCEILEEWENLTGEKWDIEGPYFFEK